MGNFAILMKMVGLSFKIKYFCKHKNIVKMISFEFSHIFPSSQVLLTTVIVEFYKIHLTKVRHHDNVNKNSLINVKFSNISLKM